MVSAGSEDTAWADHRLLTTMLKGDEPDSRPVAASLARTLSLLAADTAFEALQGVWTAQLRLADRQWWDTSTSLDGGEMLGRW